MIQWGLVNIEKARQILTALQQAGHEAYVVGGAVRDHLLGVVPQDIDIATSAHYVKILTLKPGVRNIEPFFWCGCGSCWWRSL